MLTSICNLNTFNINFQINKLVVPVFQIEKKSVFKNIKGNYNFAKSVLFLVQVQNLKVIFYLVKQQNKCLYYSRFVKTIRYIN